MPSLPVHLGECRIRVLWYVGGGSVGSQKREGMGGMEVTVEYSGEKNISN